MLIHSIAPPQFLTEQPELPECVWRSTGFGQVQGYKTAEGFCVARMQSTNPRMYLRQEYSPGSILNERNI